MNGQTKATWDIVSGVELPDGRVLDLVLDREAEGEPYFWATITGNVVSPMFSHPDSLTAIDQAFDWLEVHPT